MRHAVRMRQTTQCFGLAALGKLQPKRRGYLVMGFDWRGYAERVQTAPSAFGKWKHQAPSGSPLPHGL